MPVIDGWRMLKELNPTDGICRRPDYQVVYAATGNGPSIGTSVANPFGEITVALRLSK
jgi:hypothetical protein